MNNKTVKCILCLLAALVLVLSCLSLSVSAKESDGSFSVPQTGDAGDMALWITLAAVSLAVLIALVLYSVFGRNNRRHK